MALEIKKDKVSTRELLIQVAIDALDEVGEPNMRLENILATAGVSVSSLYHYFGNLRGLINAANVQRFGRVYSFDLESFSQDLEKAHNRDDFRRNVIAVVNDIFSPHRMSTRRQRLLSLSGLDNDPEFFQAISQAQRANTLSTAELLISAKKRGFLSHDVEPLVFSVWFSSQAFSLAMTEIVDDAIMNDMWRAQTLEITLNLLRLND